MFLSLTLFLPAMLWGQKQIKWIVYKNTNFHFSLTIPQGSSVVNDTISGADFVLDLPIKHKAVRADRLYITIKKSDTCCTNTLREWPSTVAVYGVAIQKIKLKEQFFYFVQNTNLSMGCERELCKDYAICSTIDKSCFIFSSRIRYFGRYSFKKSNCLDSDVNFEIEIAKKVVASLKFID